MSALGKKWEKTSLIMMNLLTLVIFFIRLFVRCNNDDDNNNNSVPQRPRGKPADSRISQTARIHDSCRSCRFLWCVSCLGTTATLGKNIYWITIRHLHNNLWPRSKLHSFCFFFCSISFFLSFFQTAENMELLCRDESFEGLVFHPNLFV